MAEAKAQTKGKDAAKGKEKPKTNPRKSVKKVSWFFSGPGRIIGPRLILIACVVLLLVIGLVMIYSSSSITAYTDYADPMYFFKRQLIFLAVGLVACIVLAVIPYRAWSHPGLSGALWLFAIALLVLLYVRGNNTLGATRILSVGSFALQPTEFAKIAILMLEASLLARQREGLITPLAFTISCAATFVISMLLIYIQPDLGTAMILGIGFLILLFLGGIDARIIIGLVALLAAYFVFTCIVQPYHIARFISTYNPWSDPLGEGYQTIQGFLALGSGGLFGTGLGLSHQKYLYLPYAYNDFIYAVIGEELGFIGAVVVLALFALFIFAGLRIARTAPDIFGSMLTGAFTGMIGFQAILNMAMVAGLFPVTGKALPLISYGGSSLISTLMMVGMIMSVSLRSKSGARYERRRDDLVVLEGGRSAAKAPQQSAGGQSKKKKKPKGAPTKPKTTPAAAKQGSAKSGRGQGTKQQGARGKQQSASSKQARSGGKGSSAPATSGKGRGKKGASSSGKKGKGKGASAQPKATGQTPKTGSEEARGRLSYSSANRRKSTYPSDSSPKR